mgnify:CR=1 FL=1|jgi:hypothetical protein|nr:MAG TPA: hypothetical protein [Caudoviricetes sp.]
MDAVEYVKELRRLHKMQKICNGCPLRNNDTCIAGLCDDGLCDEAEKAVQIVEQWAKDHPIKTRQSEFLKMFPNAQMVNIERTFCVAHFDSTKKCKEILPSDEQCIACRYKFWNEEVTDND